MAKTCRPTAAETRTSIEVLTVKVAWLEAHLTVMQQLLIDTLRANDPPLASQWERTIRDRIAEEAGRCVENLQEMTQRVSEEWE